MLIDKATLRPAAWKALIDAGWYPERQIATERWQIPMVQEDLHWLSSATAFLAAFGGITVHPHISPQMKFGRGACTFDPLVGNGRYAYTDFYEALLGEPLCPIGVWEQEVALVNARSQVFAGWESDYLLLLGDTPQAALEAIVCAYTYPVVLHGETWWSNSN